MRAIPENPLSADLTYWEAVYSDGTTMTEDQGSYSQIDRNRLKAFRLIKGAEVVFEMTPPPGFTGQNLVYRRRTAMSASTGDRRVLIILGWAPGGPAFAIDMDTGSYRVSEEGFILGDPDMYPPMAFPGEPDIF